MRAIDFEALLSQWQNASVVYNSFYNKKEFIENYKRFHISFHNGMWDAYRETCIISKTGKDFHVNVNYITMDNVKKAAAIVAAKRKEYRTEKPKPDAIKVETAPVTIKSSTPKVKKEPRTKMAKKVDIHRNDGVLVDLTLQECKTKLEANGFVVLPKPNKGESYEVTSDKKTLACINAKVKLQKKLNAYQKLISEIVTLFNKIQ